MNHVVRSAAAAGPHAAPLATTRAAAFFHSTPISERKRRTHWNSGRGSFSSKKFNYYARRARKFESKRTLLCNISDYAEYLFQSWRDEAQSNSSINDDTSWFRRQYGSKGTRENGFGLHELQWGSCRTKRNGSFEFCTSDDDEVETMFHSAFGGERFHDYYWSFHTENFHSGHANFKSSRNWRYQTDDETDTSPESDLTSERLALGLRASGSLKLEEVKNAYRACALRWHPDRHQGSSKVAAEERFKHCSAAYKVLCDKLAIA